MGADIIFRHETEETTGHEIKLFNDELRCFAFPARYCSGDLFREDEMGWELAYVKER